MNNKLPPEFESYYGDEPSLDRSNADEISGRSQLLYDNVFYNHPTKEILDSLFDIVMILDVNRQAVFVNKALLKYFELKKPESVLGRRPGEIFDCVHAWETDTGCGTTRACTVCEAQRAIQAGLHGNVDVRECHITKKDGSSVELGISSAPLLIGNEHFVLFIIKDISDRKRMQSLEQVFFHDVLNTSSVIWNLASLLAEGKKEGQDRIGARIFGATRKLISDIEAQRNLIWAENNQLVARMEPVESLSIMRECVSLYEDYGARANKTIEIDPASENIAFKSDLKLLRRVIENMLKNALEASGKQDVITLGCRRNDGSVEFRVHNSGSITEDVRHHIFMRGFSTKAKERGLGTYSIRLISERYLHGRVWFESTEESGTTFYASYPIQQAPNSK